MTFKVIPLTENKIDWWNNFIEESNEGTLFHRLDFLSYHGERFKTNEHHLIIFKGEQPFGVFPLSIFNIENKIIAKSPYGGSYGGPAFKNNLDYKESGEVIESILNYLKNIKVSELTITLPIMPCYKTYSDTFRFSLLENNFKCINRDIESAVLLDNNKTISDQISSRARNMIRKAEKSGVEIIYKEKLLDFWTVLNLTFNKHGKPPTHTFENFEYLFNKFKDRIYVDVAYYENKPIAGIGYFVLNKRVNSSFYFAQDPEFQNIQALTLLIYNALKNSRDEGYLWFDFGTSSVNMKGSENIFNFKESFNSIGIFRESYRGEL